MSASLHGVLSAGVRERAGGLLQVWEVEGKVFAQGCIRATRTGRRPQADAETESSNEAESRADDEAEADKEADKAEGTNCNSHN